MPYVRKNLQYQAAAGIETMGAGLIAASGKCIKRAMQMFCGKELGGRSTADVLCHRGFSSFKDNTLMCKPITTTPAKNDGTYDPRKTRTTEHVPWE